MQSPIASVHSLRPSRTFVLEMDVPFKGKRRYVHFPDVYEALRNHLHQIHGNAALNDLTMSFRLELHRRPVFLYGPADTFDGGDYEPSFELALTANGVAWKGWLVETDSMDLPQIDDTQHLITPLVKIDAECVSMQSASGEPAMEELITMAKEYFKTRFEATQFRMAKIVLTRPIEPHDAGKIVLQFQPRARRTFLKSRIFSDGIEIGYGLGAALV